MVAALSSEPRTFNPVTAADAASVSVIQAMNANLVHIDRQDQEAKPALAERWTVDDDGRRYTLVLRPGLRFSDGHPATADDVVFSFQVYLDEKVDSPQRDLLIVGGEPIQVRKVDDRTVEFRLAEPYGVAERLFDGFAILPRHLLEAAYRAGTLASAWGIDTPPAKMAGLGPFRLRERRAGERLVLERNPFYWKQDEPYLDELVFLTVPSADAQAVRFEAGELDVVDRLSAESFDRLSRDGARRGLRLTDAGPGLDLNFLFFNQNDLGTRRLPELRRRQGWFRQTAFRQAVSAAIDRNALVRVVYRGRATPLNSHETPGSHWLDKALPPPRYAPDEARRLLRAAGFSWDAAGALHDPAGARVGFTLLVVAGNAERGPMATLIQEDLRRIGMDVKIAALELQAVLDRLFTSYDYDAAVLGLDGGDADPNPSMSILLSDGSHHFWRLTRERAARALGSGDRPSDEGAARRAQSPGAPAAVRPGAGDRDGAAPLDRAGDPQRPGGGEGGPRQPPARGPRRPSPLERRGALLAERPAALMAGITGHEDDWIGHLAGLEDEAESRTFLAARTDLHGRPAVERLSRELVRYALEDLRQSERLARAVSWLSEAVGDDFCRALAAKSRGHAAYLSGRYEEARGHYGAAVERFRAVGAEIEAAVVLSSSLQNSSYLGLFREALEDARQAREVFTRHGDRLLLARLASNEGNILVRQDRHAAALELFRAALAELRQIGDPQDLVAVLTNVGVCAIELHDFAQALEAYGELSAYCERHGMALAAAQADYNIAYLYYQRGQYTRALEMYQRSRAWSLEAGDPYELALCDLDQAEIYLELNLTEEGERLAQLAFAAFEELALPYEGAKTVAFLAIAAHQQGRSFQALRLFDEARQRFVAQENLVWPAAIDLYQALILYEAGRSPEARRLAERARELFESARQGARAALCDVLLARIDLQVGQPRAARERCRAALRRLDALDIPASSAKAWFVLGQAEEALGDRTAALAAYRAAHGLLENLRAHLHREELKISFFRDKLELYQSLVALTEDPRDAFTYVEQAKSRSLADLIAFRAQALRPSRSTHSELVDRMRRLRDELNWYYRQIDVHELQAPPSPAGDGAEARRARIEDLRRLSREQEAKLLETLSELRTADAELGSLQTAATLDVDEIQAAIPPDCVLVEYYEARGILYVALVGPGLLEVWPITTGLRVRELQRLLQFQLSKFRLGADYCRTFAAQIHAATRAHLSELHAELLAPVVELLEDAEHLVIVPHGSLHYLPFHALFDGERYLIDRFTLSYAPSASVFAMCCAREAPAGRGSLILGIPDRLTPSILDEVKAVAATLPGAELLLAEEATEERLRALGAGARLVHIATHGFFRQDNPMFSAIQLGGSRLTLFDLYQLELASELVVLSGCGTGLNVVESGDELIGLTRGLLYAGAHSAMVTLWDVHDRSTAEFMSAFYRQLSRRPNPALAARLAMQELREAYPHPYYWAPFVLVGKPFEIDPRNGGSPAPC